MKRHPSLSPLCLLRVCTSEPTRSSRPPPSSRRRRSRTKAATPSRGASRAKHYSLDPLVGTWTTRFVNVSADGTERPHLGNAKIMGRGRPLLNGCDARYRAAGARRWATWLSLNRAEYQLLMISDLTTGMSVAHGRGDINAKGIRLTIEVVDPTSGAIKRAQSTLRLVDKNHSLLEQLGVDPQGEERIVRRTHYQRRGASASP
jgi:hypothetical protein